MSITEVIAKRIEEKGMLCKAVAEKAGIDPKIFSLCMTGRRRFLAAEFVEVCHVLGLEMSDFRPVRAV